MKKINTLRATVVAVVLATGSTSWATDGYFPHGYGMKALGMGGASVAMTDNAFAGANNPATAAFAGNRYEMGVNLFSPKRSAVTADGQGGMMETKSESNYFLVPEFGYNRSIDEKTSFGLTVYGNGGMNTNYPLPIMGGSGRTGVDLMQLIVAPTLAYKLDGSQSVGVSPLLVYQRFKAEGLQAFGITPNKGRDSSTGVGVRLGYFAKISDQLSLGASFSPKVNMSKLDKYAGLFVNQGEFDIPANAAFGVAIQASPTVKLAIDYQSIKYGSVPAIANSSQNILACNNGAGDLNQCLGASNGPGFGWSNVNVIKLGAEWTYSSSTTLRAGFNKSTNPVSSNDVTFNILAPAVMTKHYTFGGTYKLTKDAELTWAYMYAPRNSVSGDSLFATLSGTPGAWQDTVRMSQQSLGVQYGWKF
jgi:long-chain fatty acid transport protein